MRLPLAGRFPVGAFRALAAGFRVLGDTVWRQRPPGDAELGRGLADLLDRLEGRPAEIDRRLAARGGARPGRLEELLAGRDQFDRPRPDPLRVAGEHD